MKRLSILITFCIAMLCINLRVSAQYSPAVHDSLVKVLVNRHTAISQAKGTMHGYRVQIYFGPQRNSANEVKDDFSKLYADIPAYLSYQQPNFKIRVGNFTTRLEALKFLKEIQPYFSTAFIVEDEVMLPE